MIRHHIAQDQLSAEATSIYPIMGVTAMPQAASLPGQVPVLASGRGDYGTSWEPPFPLHAAPVSALILVVASIVAILTLIKVRWEAIDPRSVPASRTWPLAFGFRFTVSFNAQDVVEGTATTDRSPS